MITVKTYRGHIRNWKELCAELEIDPALPREEKEQEILVKAYQKWGGEMADHIYGMFAFALWDEEEKKLFCLRDQFGTKPFYYYQTEDGELRTMPGVKNLIRYQQNIAAESGIAFWNMFEAMGGEGSMANLVHAKPSMANYDYTHINFRGGKHLAGLLYETLIYGKEQYDRRRAYEQE